MPHGIFVNFVPENQCTQYNGVIPPCPGWKGSEKIKNDERKRHFRIYNNEKGIDKNKPK